MKSAISLSLLGLILISASAQANPILLVRRELIDSREAPGKRTVIDVVDYKSGEFVVFRYTLGMREQYPAAKDLKDAALVLRKSVSKSYLLESSLKKLSGPLKKERQMKCLYGEEVLYWSSFGNPNTMLGKREGCIAWMPPDSFHQKSIATLDVLQTLIGF